MVLSSNAIAATTSTCPPPPDFPFSFGPSDDGYLHVTFDPKVALYADFTGYSWQINSYTLGPERALQIRTFKNQPIVTGPTPDNCFDCPTKPVSGTESVIVSPANSKTETPEPFVDGNIYSIEVWIHWDWNEGCVLDAYYDISGEWPKIPTLTRL